TAVWLRSAGVWAASATIFALVAAFESSTAVRRSMRVCRNASTCTGVSVAFANVSELTFAKYFFVPAISCFARATSVSPVFMVFFLLSGPVLGDPQPLEDARTMRALRRSRRDVATRLVPVLSFLKNRHQGRVPG